MVGAAGAHPAGQAVLHLGVSMMSDHHLALESHAGMDESRFPIAMGRLVEVHEVHVDAAPGQVPTELRVQVDEGLVQDGQSADPHLGRAKALKRESASCKFAH